MALIHMNFFSETLGMCTSLDAIVPQKSVKGQIGVGGKWRERMPALYLLHGYSDDHTIWQRRTSIERYAAEYPLIVIMPAAEHSFYTDMAHGFDFFTYISQELPAVCESMLPISPKREDRFVAGLSMGGYGAFLLGLRAPEKYAAAASLSGVLDIASRPPRLKDDPRNREQYDIFGDLDKLPGSQHDLMALAAKLDPKDAPKLYAVCGTEDFLLGDNRAFRDAYQEKFNMTYVEAPGTHEWGFWDTHIQSILKWLPIQE